MLSKLQSNESFRKASLVGLGTVAALSAYMAYKGYNKNTLDDRIPICKSLDQKTAQKRRRRIVGTVNYDIYVILGESKEFSGAVRIEFTKDKKGGDLWQDFIGVVNRLEINGVVLKKSYTEETSNFDGAMLRLASEDLKEGENVIVIDYTSEYSTNAAGMSHLPKSNEIYIFSWNETYGTRGIFPCFCQPDVRGNMKLWVAHPNRWVVTANERKKGSTNYVDCVIDETDEFMYKAYHRLQNEVDDHDLPDYELTEFMNTPDFPQYLFSQNAGPYQMIKGNKPHGKVKSNIYCQKDKYADMLNISELIFDVTNFGLNFYEKWFSCNYPYSKYDYTFAPNLSKGFGACEQPGNVIFDDSLLNADNALSNTILVWVIFHEMVHMWFGDLMNIDWFSDTWLKEAFADYFSLAAYEEYFYKDDNKKNLIHPELWFSLRKHGGMLYDSQPLSTRAIRGSVELCANAEIVYNRIVYGKSFAVVREIFQMLSNVPGYDFEKVFTKTYIEKNAKGTLTVEKFVEGLKTAVKVQNNNSEDSLANYDFEKIVKDHFTECKGQDHLEFDINYKTQKLNIRQKPSNENRFRSHCFDIAFYSEELKLLCVKLIKMPAVENHVIDLESQSNELQNEHVLIQPNYSNFGYFSFDLEEDERTALCQNLHKLDTKACIILNQYEFRLTMCGRLLIDEYLDMVLELAEHPSGDFKYGLFAGFVAQLRDRTEGMLNKHIKYRIYEHLKKKLLLLEGKDMLLIHMLLEYAPGKKQVREVYQWIFKHKTFERVRKEMTVNSQNTFCKILCFNPALKEHEQLSLLDILKERSLTDYNSLSVRRLVNTMDKTELYKLWNQWSTAETIEETAHAEMNKRKGFLQNVEKLEMEGGYWANYFRSLTNYVVNHDMYSVHHFQQLMPPDGTKEDKIFELERIRSSVKLLEDEDYMLVSTINELSISSRLQKANS